MSLIDRIKESSREYYNRGKGASQKWLKSYSRATGLFDAGAGVGLGVLAFILAKGNVLTGFYSLFGGAGSTGLISSFIAGAGTAGAVPSVAAAIAGTGTLGAAAGACLGAFATVCVSALFVVMTGIILGGLALGFLTAAREKAGLPPLTTPWYRAKGFVNNTVAPGVKKVFAPLTSVFKRSANKKKPSSSAPSIKTSGPDIF